MSENITHTAVVDDGLRLMQAAGTVCEAFKQAARDHLDIAHLGCMTRAGDRCNPGLLATFRDRWADRTPDDLLEPKLAFVLGWLCHRAADREYNNPNYPGYIYLGFRVAVSEAGYRKLQAAGK